MVSTKTPPSAQRSYTVRVGAEHWQRGELLAVAMSERATDILRHTDAPTPLPSTASVLRAALEVGLRELEQRLARESNGADGRE